MAWPSKPALMVAAARAFVSSVLEQLFSDPAEFATSLWAERYAPLLASTAHRPPAFSREVMCTPLGGSEAIAASAAKKGALAPFPHTDSHADASLVVQPQATAPWCLHGRAPGVSMVLTQPRASVLSRTQRGAARCATAALCADCPPQCDAGMCACVEVGDGMCRAAAALRKLPGAVGRVEAADLVDQLSLWLSQCVPTLCCKS